MCDKEGGKMGKQDEEADDVAVVSRSYFPSGFFSCTAAFLSTHILFFASLHGLAASRKPKSIDRIPI